MQVGKWIQANALHAQVCASTHSRMPIPKYKSCNSGYSVPSINVFHCSRTESLIMRPHPLYSPSHDSQSCIHVHEYSGPRSCQWDRSNHAGLCDGSKVPHAVECCRLRLLAQCTASRHSLQPAFRRALLTMAPTMPGAIFVLDAQTRKATCYCVLQSDSTHAP